MFSVYLMPPIQRQAIILSNNLDIKEKKVREYITHTKQYFNRLFQGQYKYLKFKKILENYRTFVIFHCNNNAIVSSYAIQEPNLFLDTKNIHISITAWMMLLQKIEFYYDFRDFATADTLYQNQNFFIRLDVNIFILQNHQIRPNDGKIISNNYHNCYNVF